MRKAFCDLCGKQLYEGMSGRHLSAGLYTYKFADDQALYEFCCWEHRNEHYAQQVGLTITQAFRGGIQVD